MIQLDFDWSEPVNQLTGMLAIAVLLLQLWFLIFRNPAAFTRRTAIRLGLNVLLWMAVAAYLIQPYFKKNRISATGIIIGKDVPSAYDGKLTDSLNTAEAITLAKPGTSDFQDFESLLSNIDTLSLAGQNFNPELFGQLMQAKQNLVIKWISYSGPDQIQNMHWKAVLQKGEMQRVHGNTRSSKKQILKLRFGRQILDSTMLKPGLNTFKLAFPVFSQGRSLAELVLENKTIDTIHFFSRPAKPLTFQFILSNPDFESRSLATWLGKNGHSVSYTATLSKDICSKPIINKAKEADVILTGPENASSALVKKAVAIGKSVLFINLTDPSADIRRINAALHTKLQVRKISNDAAINISPELTALPYHFISFHPTIICLFPAIRRQLKKMIGKIGASLLNETFLLMLNGDSITYQKVWNTILSLVHPATQSNVIVQAPVYPDLTSGIELNNFPDSPGLLKMGNDTVFLNYSALNSHSTAGNFRTSKSGWIVLPEPLDAELYAENETDFSAGFHSKKMEDFVRSYSIFHARLSESVTGPDAAVHTGVRKKFSDWIWFGIVMLCLTGVWIEEKL